MKKNKILISLMIACCILFLYSGLNLPPETALAAQNLKEAGVTEGGSALVCLLDASGSMRSSDRNRLAIDSLSRLIYSLPSECKAAVVAYNNGTAFQSELTGEQGRSELVAHASGIKYAGYTDAGQGLHDAVELLKNDGSSKKTIIILSDGGIERQTAQKTKQSKDLFEASAADAAEHKIVIYVLGLGREMKDMGNEIYTAAAVTGGTAMRIESDSQIAEAIDKISHDSGAVKKDATYSVDAGKEDATLVIPFPYEGASEARIVLSSDKSFEVLSVDAGGSEVTEHKGDLYTVVEVKDPHKGDITIEVRGGGMGSAVKADISPEYDYSGNKAPAQTLDAQTASKAAQIAAAIAADPKAASRAAGLAASIAADPQAASKAAGLAASIAPDPKSPSKYTDSNISQAAAEASKALDQAAAMGSKPTVPKPEKSESGAADQQADGFGQGGLSGSEPSSQTGNPPKTVPSRTGLSDAGGSSKTMAPQAAGNPGEDGNSLAEGFTGEDGNQKEPSKPSPMEVLKNRGITEDEAMAAVFIIILVMFGVLIVINVKNRPKKTPSQFIKIHIRGGRFGRQGFALRYSLFRLRQQDETSLSEILASGGIDTVTAGSEKIHFKMREKGGMVLVNDSDCEVRYRRKKVTSGGREEMPSLLSMRIFVQNADSGLKVRRLIIHGDAQKKRG